MSIFSKFILKKITVFLSLFCAVFVAVFSATDFSVSAEAGQTGLDSAYVDMADPGPVYALFGMDLTSYSGMLSSLLSNFELLNESDASCGTATSASLLAMFYDIENQFVELEFSSVNCPESTSPARLKFIDPGNSSIYDIVDILDVSEIGSGGGGELEDWGSTTGDDHEVIVDISFDSWEEYPIYIFGIYGESGEGDLGGYTSISAPGIVSIYVPHADDEDYVTIVAAWWDSPDLDMDSDPAMMGFSDPILIDGSGPTSIEILLEENVGGGGGDGPQIGNVSYSNITGTSVSLSSEIISLADRTITRRGFILDRLSDNFTINVSEDSMSGFGTGVYSLSALNLDCGTNYNVRPFIMDSTYSEWHGSTVNFTTGSCGGGGGSNVNYDVYVRMGDEYEWDDVEGASVNFGAYSCDTNDGGWCSVSDVIPGSYTITVTADYYEDYSAESITIDSDNRSYIAYMTPTTVGSLSGLITDGNSDGIDGATVFSILFDSDTPPLSPATTSGGGHFSFSDLYEGSGHFVMAAKDGYVGKYIGPGDLLMSNDNSHYDMQLETATSANSGSISGSFTIDDVPVSGLKVLVFTFGDDVSWPEVLGFGFGETDALGEYVVNGLAPSDSYIVFFVEDFLEYEDVGMHSASVTAGQDTGLDYNILAPDVATVSATNVGVGNARLTASIGDTYEVNSIGYLSFDNIDESGFEYGTAVGGVFTDQSDWTDEDDDTGEFYTEIYSLDCGTEYQYRALASTAAGTDYGETMYFTTASCGGGGNEPQIANVSYSNITATSVDLSSEIISLADRTITRRGFILDRLSDNFTINVSEDSMSGFGTGVYSLSALNLDCGTNYNVRPFIMDSTYSEWHGSTVNFTTASCGGGGGSNVNYDVYVRMGDEYEWDDVEGASVNFGAYSCETNDGGWCAVSNVVPGSYTITVTADYYEDYSAENVTIDSDNRSYIAYMTPNSIGSLSGLITDENSDGIDGVTVFSILFDSDTAPFAPTTTSGGGYFSFSDLYEGGGHFVMAAKDGYVGQYIGPGDLLMSNDNSHYDMQLETATSANSGSISGSFTVDDVPVSGLKVLVFTFGDDEGWPEVLGFGFGETDALGEYVVNGLAPSDSYIVFFVEDFLEYEDVGMHSASVTAGQDTTLDYNILAPEVSTMSATDVSDTQAVLTASIGNTYEVNDVGYLSFDNIDESGFEYGTVLSGTFANQSDWTDEDDDAGEFYTRLYSLNCGTEYRYRAFASTAVGMDYGETMYFTTSACGGGSTSSSTNGSSNATKDSVTLSGSFNVASGDVVTRRGFDYGTDIAYGSSVFEDGNWNSGSSYSLNVSGTLPCGTTHHFRSYVTLSNFMTYYGSDMTFSTLSCDDGGGGEDGDLEGAYVDGSDFSAVYALFGSDLSGFSEMIPMLNSNFELLNVNDVSCGAASSASLMATFYDVQNRFVQLGFSSINCPESTSPVKLKFTDPGDPSKYQLIDLQDVSDIGAGGTTADWSTQTGDDHFTVVTVSYEDWVQYPIVVVGWYADSVESVSGDPAGFVAISSPGIATLYIPHEEGADYVVLAALWWNNAEMDGDPSLIGFYDTPISIDGPGTTSIAIDLGETGGGNAVTAAQAAGVLACEFVDSDWQSLSSLNVSTSPLSYDPVSPIYANSVLGNDSSYILIANPTSNPTWTLSVAPTDGEDALWSDGDGNYADFNDSDTGDDDDLDGFGGRLSINPVLGTLFTYSLDYSNDGISVGSYASFTDGSVNNITLLTADEFSDAPGYWGLKNIGIDQIFPAGQDVGTYTFDLTISVI